MRETTVTRSNTAAIQREITPDGYATVKKVADQIESVQSLAAAIDANTDFNAMAQVIDKLGDSVSDLAALAQADLVAISADLVKGNYLGNRKIDIDLALNNTSSTVEVTYRGATLTTNTGSVIQIDFTSTDGEGNEVVEELASFTAIYNAISDGIDAFNLSEPDPQKHIVNTEIDIINSTFADLPTMIRFRDTDGSASSIDRIQLQVFSGSAVEIAPTYFWAKTTSALQTLANRVGDVIALGNDIDSIIVLASQTDEIGYLYTDRDKLTGDSGSLYSELSKIQDIHLNLVGLVGLSEVIDEILALYADQAKLTGPTDSIYSELDKLRDVFFSLGNVTLTADSIDNVNSAAASIADINFVANNIVAIQNAQDNADTATAKAAEAASSASIAATQSSLATDQVVLATEQAVIAADKADEIKGVTVGNTSTGVAGGNALVTYNSLTGSFNFVIPQGTKGDKGDAFQVNSVGLFASRPLYDTQIAGFSFLATDSSIVYFKLSATSGDWSEGAPFGKGDKGEEGDAGKGVVGTSWLSTTDASNLPSKSGATDTYKITYTDTTFDTFNVYNGLDLSIEDSLVNSVSVWSSQQISDELAKKVNIIDIQDNLTDTSADKPLSANQGKLLNEALGTLDQTVSASLLDKADLDSPDFVNVPTAPTAPPGTNTGQLATTAFVEVALGSSTTTFTAPTAISPLEGSTGLSIVPELSATAFRNAFDEARVVRRFQVDLATGDFSDPVYEHAEDVDTHTIATPLNTDTDFKWRCRDETSYENSEWSEEQFFNTSPDFIETPTLTVQGSPSSVQSKPLLSATAFSVFNGTDTHESTDWVVYENGVVVYEVLDSTSNLLSIYIPSGVLQNSTEYTFKVRFKGINLSYSDYDSVTATTGSKIYTVPILVAGSWGSSGSYDSITVYDQDIDTFTRIASNTVTPTNTVNDILFTPDDNYLIAVEGNSPFLHIYYRNLSTFTKLSTPPTPGNFGNNLAISGDGNYVLMDLRASPYMAVYSRTGGNLTKLATPSALPNGTVNGISVSSDGVYFILTLNVSPYINVYKRTGSTLTKQSILPGVQAEKHYGISFDSTGEYLYTGTSASPYVGVYKRDGDTFTRLPDINTITHLVRKIVASTGSDYVLLSDQHSTITVCKRYGDSLTKLSVISTSSGAASGMSISPDGQYISLCFNTAPRIAIYKNNGYDSYYKLPTPSFLPEYFGSSSAFSNTGFPQ